jgi:transposase
MITAKASNNVGQYRKILGSHVTSHEAARMLGVTMRTVQLWANSERRRGREAARRLAARNSDSHCAGTETHENQRAIY